MSNFLEIIDDALLSNLLFDAKNAFVLLCLATFRLIPIFIVLPILSGKQGPNYMRIILLILTTIFLLPYICQLEHPRMQLSYPISTIAVLMVKEIGIGCFCAFALNLPFAIIQSAGIIGDHARGASSMMGSDLLTREQTSPTATLFSSLLIAMFLQTPILVYEFFKYIVRIFIEMPILNVTDSFDIALLTTLTHTAPILFEKSINLSCQISAPMLLSSLLIDVGMSLIGKTSPQMQISFISTAFKALAGSFILLLTWNSLMKFFINMFLNWFKIINQTTY